MMKEINVHLNFGSPGSPKYKWGQAGVMEVSISEQNGAIGNGTLLDTRCMHYFETSYTSEFMKSKIGLKCLHDPDSSSGPAYATNV